MHVEGFFIIIIVSNLAFLGEVIEKAAIQQVDQHISNNNLHEPSAYTKNHSTETALLKVSNDILCALDKGKGVYMVLLDLSAAFDTIDHTVFLSRLPEDYGVTGGVADWMQSYLSNCHQSISINGTLSEKSSLDWFPTRISTRPLWLPTLYKTHHCHSKKTQRADSPLRR